MTVALPGLREARRERAITQEALAQLAGCSLTSIRNVEHGRACSTELANRIARVLDADALELTATRTSA